MVIPKCVGSVLAPILRMRAARVVGATVKHIVLDPRKLGVSVTAGPRPKGVAIPARHEPGAHLLYEIDRIVYEHVLYPYVYAEDRAKSLSQ
ncbi:MAG: hypothetical protein AMS14_09450 [Planctomycetes bacterium DG_20]|nr:MAG: hypothetical protein AMS14_09450 [Planctomycetes bacterium DG_20]